MARNSTQTPDLQAEKKKPNYSLRWFILGLSFFVLIMLIVFFSSALSRVQQIQVTGNQLISTNEIIAASQVKQNDQFLFTRIATVREGVRSIDAFENVTINKDFPGKVLIVVQEYPHIAYIMNRKQQYQRVLANGKILPTEDRPTLTMPILRDWNNQQRLAKVTTALRQVDSIHLRDLSEIIPTPSKTYPTKFTIYTRSGYEVITTAEFFPEKIVYLQNIIDKLRAKEQRDGRIFLLETTYHQPFGSLNDGERTKIEEE